MNTITAHTSTMQKRQHILAFISLLLISMAISVSAQAQTAYRAAGSQNTITLYGTSTLHDWTMVAHSFSCEAKFDVSQSSQLSGLESLTFSLPVHNLKSDHDGLNDNAYESLKADQYKDIIFRLASAKLTSAPGNKEQLTASGNLTIAGVTKPVTMIATAQVNADGTITCTGTVQLKMSSYNVERPSFFLGTMKTGDDLKLAYTLVFAK